MVPSSHSRLKLGSSGAATVAKEDCGKVKKQWKLKCEHCKWACKMLSFGEEMRGPAEQSRGAVPALAPSQHSSAYVALQEGWQELDAPEGSAPVAELEEANAVAGMPASDVLASDMRQAICQRAVRRAMLWRAICWQAVWRRRICRRLK